MKKKAVYGLVATLMLLLVASGLYASNMGFKLNYVLEPKDTNGSANGTNTIALPFNQQTDLNDAFDLLNDIGGTATVAAVEFFDRTANAFPGYTGTSGEPFGLIPGDAYRVRLQVGVPTQNYIVVGSHDPNLMVHFDGQDTNGSRNGTNFYAYPYHSISTFADELINELGGTAEVAAIGQFDRTSNAFPTYTGTSGEAFALVPGQGYQVRLVNGVVGKDFRPEHY